MSEYFENDHFNRIEDAELIERFLTKRVQEKKFGNVVGTYVLNLDSAWGTGKTYFLDGLEKYLSSTDGGSHLVVNIDAWKDDYSDDPLPYITSSIHSSIIKKLGTGAKIPSKKLAESLGKIVVAGAKGGAGQLAKKAFGEHAVVQILEEGMKALLDPSGEAIISSVNAQQDAVKKFQDALKEISAKVEKNKNTNGPIFVLVDELDRCRPDYAIKFLERIKHFFAVEGFVFIIATDTEQLKSAVKGAYGAEFDGERYLQRFSIGPIAFPSRI